MRLNKYIASSGVCSRRKADELIEQGVVSVNGKKITELGFQISEKDKVFINNEIIKPKKHEYYRFYKPTGYITTADDEKDRKIIYDLFPPSMHNLKPVGRLDMDSSGLIILTNDGDLINKLTHPSIKVPKVYIVTVNGKVHLHQLEKMAQGIQIEEGKTAYAQSQIIESTNKSTVLQITLYQGLNRQIRKMFETFGLEVISLKRIQHATIDLEGLKKGQFKPIKPQQIKELKNFLNKIKREKC
jgi:23S rRNA pseudouridine2605 synthase